MFRSAILGLSDLSLVIDFFLFSNEMLCRADKRGYFTHVNPAWEKVLGWSPEQITGRPYIDFVHPDDKVATLAEAEMLFTGNHETVRFENRYQHRDGSYRWLAWYSALEPVSGELVASARDVTDQKLQAEALRVSEERLRLFVQATNDAVWDIDVVAGTVWWSDGYDRCFGPRPKSSAQSWDWWADRIHPADRGRTVQTLKDAIAGNEGHWICEYRFRQPDGGYSHVFDRAFLARDAQGRTTRVLGAMLDLTKQKAAEDDLRAKADTIRKLFELQEQERRLISHDIHDGLAQLIVGALMQLECARDSVSAEQAPTLATALDLLSQAMAESRRLINDLRPMIIDERGITDSVKHLVADWKQAFHCEFHLTSELDAEHIDPLFDGVVFRIIQEAGINALRHGEATKIDILIRQEDSRLTILVEDNGRGFELDKVPADRFGVRGIIERAKLFGGDASINSRVGLGTSVCVHMTVPGWSGGGGS